MSDAVFPLFQHGSFGRGTSLVLGTLVGIAFGFVLERSGFGRAPVLAAQFYGSDTRVLKVMFTAIVTALAGTTVLSAAGVLDLSAVHVPETVLWAQIAGGLLLGVGFIVSGYCPGTSCVAAASGNLDGLATFAGVIAGSVVFGLAWPVFEALHGAGAMGVVRLPDLLGMPQAALAAAVLAMAAGAFVFGEWVERALARRRGEPPPPSRPAIRNRVLGGLAGVTALGLVFAALPRETPTPPDPVVASIDPVALASDLVERPWSLAVVDLRPAADCEAARVPGAACLPSDDPAGFLANLPPSRTLVLYGESDLDGLPDVASRFPGRVALLRGGFAAFSATILTKPEPPSPATPEALAAFRIRSALHARFTGAKALAPPPPAPARVPAPAAKKKGGGC